MAIRTRRSNSPSVGSAYTNFPSPATSNGTYPSWVNECLQQVTAAQAATSAGTLVYTVAYGLFGGLRLPDRHAEYHLLQQPVQRDGSDGLRAADVLFGLEADRVGRNLHVEPNPQSR